MKPLTLLLLAAVLSLPAPGARRTSVRERQAPCRPVQFGLASWYGARHQGRKTASGARFDEHKFTAAHRTWPLGSRVKVTNLRNGSSVVVKITDRGPGLRGRIIDLSEAAARRLGFIHRGLTPVKATRLGARHVETGCEAPAPDLLAVLEARATHGFGAAEWFVRSPAVGLRY